MQIASTLRYTEGESAPDVSDAPENPAPTSESALENSPGVLGTWSWTTHGGGGNFLIEAYWFNEDGSGDYSDRKGKAKLIWHYGAVLDNGDVEVIVNAYSREGRPYVSSNFIFYYSPSDDMLTNDSGLKRGRQWEG